MTQEDKDLLLKDLCARLYYRPYVQLNPGARNKPEKCRICGISGEDIYLNVDSDPFSLHDFNILPYLRPMSSITEEEKKDILQSLNIHGDIDNEGNLLLGAECNIITLKICKKYLGELNKRMFDVCHMIEKGLALEAPKGMY